ncbi:DNA replication licensing factor MCM4, partial [Zancudomyces culisetae]
RIGEGAKGVTNDSDVFKRAGHEVVFSSENVGQKQDKQLEDMETMETENPQEMRVIWGTMINIRDVMNVFRDFLRNFTMKHFKDWEKIILERTRAEADVIGELIEDLDMETDEELTRPYYPVLFSRMKEMEVWQLNLDAQHLLAYPKTRKLYRQLISYPEEVIPIMDHIISDEYMQQYPEEQYDVDNFELKVRPCNLVETKNMRELDPGDMDKLVCIKGMLVRATSVIPDMEQGFFKCLHCDWTTMVSLENGIIQEPTRCGNVDCGANGTMELIHNRCVFTDKQICKLQETPDVIPDGQTPHTVSLVLHDELVDSIRPGDRLEIVGVFRGVPVRPKSRNRTILALYRTYIDVVHLRRTAAIQIQPDILEESGGAGDTGMSAEAAQFADMQVAGVGGPGDAFDYKAGPDQALNASEESEFRKLSSDPRLIEILSHSLAPSIFQMDEVKKGLLLQLFGGERKHLRRSGAPRSRGDIHVLLIGDPGVSKSQLLSAVHKLSPRGIYTSGKGSSAVGLTAYITRDPDTRDLVLESGALVLSDGGICCIDEFDKMSDATRSILHEAMEQQTVSIAKAGIIATLNARTAILAAANPIDSKWNRQMSIVENINLPHSLVSRFDLIYILLDNVQESQDRRLARHIVSLYIDPTLSTADSLSESTPTISTHKLARYVNYARKYIRPVISDEAANALVSSYVELRKMGRDSSSFSAPNNRVTATARQLESIIRLSEAHARMRLSNSVDVNDVMIATSLMREALRESATDPRTGLIDLDLLNTGFAASDRRQLEAIKAEIKKMLAESGAGLRGASSSSGGGGGGFDDSTTNMFTYQSLFDKLNTQSSVPVGNRLFGQVIRELQTEGFIQYSGSGRSAKLIPKQSSTNVLADF